MAFLDIINIPGLLGKEVHSFKRSNVYDKLELGLAGLHSPVTVLWEIANAAARPAIYFLASPAAWEGLKHVCCSSSRRYSTQFYTPVMRTLNLCSYGSVSTKEDEVALSPVVERISSL